MKPKLVTFTPETAADAGRLFNRARRDPYNRPTPEEPPRYTPTPQLIIAKLTETLNQGDKAQAKIWAGVASDEKDSQEEITVHDWLLKSSESLPADTKLVCALINGYWYVIEASCDA